MRKVTRVKVLDGYVLDITFDDGRRGTVDLAGIAGKGVFSLWLDRRSFEKVNIGPSGELSWSDQIDLCPDALYLRVIGQKVEDLFPSLRLKSASA